MILEKLADNHFITHNTTSEYWAPSSSTTSSHNSYFSAALPVPDTVPCIVVPLNGTEQKLKEKQIFKWLEGEDFKLNVRGTFDGSSPHVDEGEDELSPNSFCDLPPDLNLPWVTSEHVASGA